MRPRDVERLFLCLLPAVSLSVACDGSTPAKSTSAGPAATVEPKPKAEPKPDSDPEPKPDPKLDPKLDSGGSGGQATPIEKATADGAEPNPAATSGGDDASNTPVSTSPPPGEPPMAIPRREENTPDCDTMEWCKARAEVTSDAAKGSRITLGCPETLTGRTSINTVATKAKRDEGDTDTCCYTHVIGCRGGRPLLDEQAQPIVAEFHPGDAWVDGSFALQGNADVLREAATQWQSDAAMEHASVASFGRVALELMALGAPPDLLELTYKAALDEIRHARRCLAIAVACGAQALEPGALPPCPPRAPDMARFAADTFIEGCVGETTAALIMERAATASSDDALRGALAEISEDESTHAALAWRTLAWALESGGATVLAAIEARAETVRATLATPAKQSTALDADRDAALASLGRLDAMALDRARHDAWFGIVEPMLRTLARSV